MAGDEFEDTDATPEANESDSDTGFSGKGDNLRGKALDAAVRKESGKTSKMGIEDVQEAVAKQLKEKGDPHPYRLGYGRTGRRDAEMVKYEQMAKKAGTTPVKALRDYHSIELAARQDPLLGIEALSQRMGWNSQDVAARFADAHFGNQGPHQLRQAAYEHNSTAAAQAIIDEAASHPANKHLRDPQAKEWMVQYVSQQMPDGRTLNAHLMEKYPDMRQRLKVVYKACDDAYRQHAMAQREAQAGSRNGGSACAGESHLHTDGAVTQVLNPGYRVTRNGKVKAQCGASGNPFARRAAGTGGGENGGGGEGENGDGAAGATDAARGLGCADERRRARKTRQLSTGRTASPARRNSEKSENG